MYLGLYKDELLLEDPLQDPELVPLGHDHLHVAVTVRAKRGDETPHDREAKEGRRRRRRRQEPDLNQDFSRNFLGAVTTTGRTRCHITFPTTLRRRRSTRKRQERGLDFFSILFLKFMEKSKKGVIWVISLSSYHVRERT